MVVRTIGIVLLGAGFVMLLVAALLRDPTALDANIGAGILLLAGIPLGALGLVISTASVVYEALTRGPRPRRSRVRA